MNRILFVHYLRFWLCFVLCFIQKMQISHRSAQLFAVMVLFILTTVRSQQNEKWDHVWFCRGTERSDATRRQSHCFYNHLNSLQHLMETWTHCVYTNNKILSELRTARRLFTYKWTQVYVCSVFDAEFNFSDVFSEPLASRF